MSSHRQHALALLLTIITMIVCYALHELNVKL